MQRTELSINKRDTSRKNNLIRREGRVPGVVYGAGGGNIAVDVEEREFVHSGLRSAGAHLIRFASDESALAGSIALVRDIQANPISGRLVHIDFLRVDPNKPVEAGIALVFVGKAAGVVEGGILQPLRREIEVRALPDKLPEHVEVDVTELNIHDSVSIEQITLPEGVELISTESFTLVTVVPPVVEVEPAAEEAEAVEGAAPAAEEGEAAAEEKTEESKKG